MLKNLMQNFLRALKFPRWRWALLAVVLSDTLSVCVTLTPELRWLSDALTLAALFAILDFRWSFLLAMIVESVPGLELLPFWTLVVAVLAIRENRKSPPATGTLEPGSGALHPRYSQAPRNV